MTKTDAKEWVVRKRGLFYRPDSQGYTTQILHAGRYTKAEADAIVHGRDEVTAHLALDYMLEGKTWLILREPGCVPVRKGPFHSRTLVATLREFMEARPTAFITVLTWSDHLGPSVEDGPECLEILDGRSASVAKRHRKSTRNAFAAMT